MKMKIKCALKGVCHIGLGCLKEKFIVYAAFYDVGKNLNAWLKISTFELKS